MLLDYFNKFLKANNHKAVKVIEAKSECKLVLCNRDTISKFRERVLEKLDTVAKFLDICFQCRVLILNLLYREKHY